MRPLIALFGVSACVVIVAVTAGTAAPSTTVASAAAAVPYATADPADTTRVVPAAAQGRLAIEDRVDRRHRVVRGLVVPIEGAALPSDPELLPNAAREFRAGWHEGIDFPAPTGTPARAIAAGTVVRIDAAFTEWDKESRDVALVDAIQRGHTPAATLDRIRGRQVWIDHGRGVVSRYAHLSSVADLAIGDRVEADQVIGAVGSSGHPEGGPHLHLEVRVGDSYLGDGLEGEALLAAVSAAFD